MEASLDVVVHRRVGACRERGHKEHCAHSARHVGERDLLQRREGRVVDRLQLHARGARQRGAARQHDARLAVENLVAADLNVGVLTVSAADEPDLRAQRASEGNFVFVVPASHGPCLAHFPGGLVEAGLLRERVGVRVALEALPARHRRLKGNTRRSFAVDKVLDDDVAVHVARGPEVREDAELRVRRERVVKQQRRRRAHGRLCRCIADAEGARRLHVGARAPRGARSEDRGQQQAQAPRSHLAWSSSRTPICVLLESPPGATARLGRGRGLARRHCEARARARARAEARRYPFLFYFALDDGPPLRTLTAHVSL